MARTPLPSGRAELEQFAYRCGGATQFAHELLELLQSFENKSCSFMLGSIRSWAPRKFTSRVNCTSFFKLHLCINRAVPEAVAEVAGLIGYFACSETERQRHSTRAAQMIATRTNWELEPLLSAENEGPNAVRITALIGYFEVAVEALSDLSRRVNRKLNPPQIRDRVKVDREQFTVTVDDEPPKLVTENQATLFFYLAEANGEGLSGPEIGKRDNFPGEFRAGRYRKQIKNKRLRNLIPDPNKSPDRKFRLVLPPLPE